MKTLFPSIVGNERLKDKIARGLLSGGRDISHAYVIEGKKGSGKRTFALLTAAAANCENVNNKDMPLPCGQCSACRKILRGFSPDVVCVEKDKSSIGVDKIREICADVVIMPNDLERKIYIINDADSMTVQAQNAFLLTLEEPPRYASFFLLCENAGALLETVRSRAQLLRMQPLDIAQTERALLAAVPEAEKIKRSAKARFDAAIASAEGSVGRAMELLGDKESEAIAARRALAADFVSLCADSRTLVRASLVLQNACGTREDAVALLGDVVAAMRDLIALKKDATVALAFFADADGAEALSERYTLGKILQIADAATEARGALAKNMNVRLTIAAMLSRIGALK